MDFDNNTAIRCCCPPSYSGDRWQWQNQRISLTLQFVYRSTTFVMPVFQMIMMLIDEHRQIASYHEQIPYVPKRDCGIKFNIYLLCPNQPKNSSTNYSIHIDVFDTTTLTYWSSWHLSIPFQFLPVDRIATRLFIPSVKQIESCPFSCRNHGRCYSGSKCRIQYNCSCSSDSFCYTSSICICPLNKYDRHCYLKHSICSAKSSPCKNNELCVRFDDRTDRNKFACLCQKRFYGTRCKNTKHRIHAKFDKDIREETIAFVLHYITAYNNV
ncbi:unnamed protein product [Rotaria magnacalcarata]|uniref:EGF-like domain-containing protein n=2 Tax=Rotaria magnacalcarata TaxID=392030 RepID=A0A816R2R7_9BILA|nr:unnamed protein product [Rotaria magnacalcarata]